MQGNRKVSNRSVLSLKGWVLAKTLDKQVNTIKIPKHTKESNIFFMYVSITLKQ